MRSTIFATLIFAAIQLTSSSALTDGGMWPLYELDKLPQDSLARMGLTLTFQQIYDPSRPDLADPIVRLRGGTASFVSAEGLLVTNHHVADAAIQKHSTVDNNYLRDGFYAPETARELPAEGYYALVTVSTEDVTDRVRSLLAGITDDLELYQTEDRIIKEIVREAEAGGGRECQLAKMYAGRQYILCTYFRIKDIRLVYIPPLAIGNYGDEIDNWMWPRHTGDFAFLRAYVAPDGSSAAYAEENVPYRPVSYLAFSSGPVREGDFTMMFGYPGKTNRYTPASELAYLEDTYFPLFISTSRDEIDIIKTLGAADSSIALRLQNKESGIENYLKKTIGIANGFKRSRIVERQYVMEEESRRYFSTWSSIDYAGLLSIMETAYAQSHLFYLRDFYWDRATSRSDLLKYAVQIATWAREREKDDSQRKRDYQDRDRDRFMLGLKDEQVNLVPSFERAILKYYFAKMLAMPPDQKSAPLDKIFASPGATEKAIHDYVDDLIDRTVVKDLGERLRMAAMSLDQLMVLGDPLIDLAMALLPELDAIDERDYRFEGAETRIKPYLLTAYESHGQMQVYPDANSTKRFNYGQVAGYSPRDAVSYHYYTTLTGIMEKETGEFPFVVPGELKTAFLSKDYGRYYDESIGDVPVDFTTTNSGTNGSSGSPVLNGSGEIIGLDFDTSLDGVTADYFYDPAIARSIVCGSSYILFVLDKVYHADSLLKELTIH